MADKIDNPKLVAIRNIQSQVDTSQSNLKYWSPTSSASTDATTIDDGLTEDDVLMAVLDAGAEEVLDEGDVFTVVSAATDLPEIRKALDEAGLEYNNDDPVFRPTMQVDLDAEGAKKFMKLADAIEELDDVQNVYSNANVSAEVMAELEAE